VKSYADVAEVITAAIRPYVDDVRAGAFPEDEHCYHMLEGEIAKFGDFVKRHS